MRRMWLGLVALALAVAGAPDPPAASGGPIGGATAVASAAGDRPGRVVTLVTGDRVVLHGRGEQETFTFVPAAGRPPHGYVSSRIAGRLRVMPRDVATLVPEVLDPALFDITTLVEEQPESSTTIPIIWRVGPGTARTELSRDLVGQRALRSIDAEGVRLPKESAEDFGAALVRARDTRGALPEKVWLDRRGSPALDRNLAQIGAPPVWASGWDGTGVTIAIIDSGVDVDHPDLQGRVVASQNFMDSPDPLDRTGHGTHVASIAAGSGAASGGERRGVAFGSRILAAKVMDFDGSGTYSATIAAAEWAVANGADVVNMSLAFPGGDAADPLVEAIESLTRSSGALFVAAAGNEGRRASIVSPGTAPSALTVGAVDHDDDHAGFSSRGPLVTGGQLKPEITAPGVDIVAASTTHGGSGDFPYRLGSGTSMAAPHVAGAAAVVMQKHPEWSAAQVKAALVGTAQEQPDAGAYDEGGGRLWLPDALAATVVPDMPAVDLGFLRYPHTGATLTRQLSWTNYGAEPETIELSTQLPPGSGTATVTPATLTLAPGTTGTATLSVETGADIGPGQHGGEVVATGGDVTVGLPFGYEREPERYDLTVRALGPDGAPNPHAMVTVLDVEDMTRFHVVGMPLADEAGVGTVRVPPGTYHVEAVIDTPDEHDGGSMTAWVVRPEVVVDRPTEVVLDARAAEPVEIAVRGSVTSHDFVQVHERRDDAAGTDAHFTVAAVGPVSGVAVAATDPVTTGRLDTYVSGRVAGPQLRLGPLREAPLQVGGAGMYVGRARLPVVDVGRGTESEIAAAAPGGALALVSGRGEPVDAVLRAAQAAGAAVVVLANDSDEPWQRFVVDVDVPAVTVTRAAAETLASRRSVQVHGSALADPSYHVVRPSAGTFPDETRYALTRRDVRRMARVDTAVAALPGTGPATYWVLRTPLVPGFAPAASLASTFPQPGLRRTEYLQAGAWTSAAYRSAERTLIELTDRTRVLGERDRVQETWFGAPWRPLTHFSTADVETPAVSRSREGLDLNLLPFADADGHQAENALTDSGAATYTLTVDGEPLEPVPGPFASVPLPPGTVDVELRYDVDAGDALPSQGRSTTVWWFRSALPDGDRAPQPLLDVALQLPVDLRGTLTGTDTTVRVTRPGGEDVVLASLAIEVSTDEGATWVPLAAELTGPAGGHARLPELPADSTVALRVSAADAGGESVRQTLWEAAQTAPQ